MAAHWAAMRTTPMSTKSTSSGSAAKMEDRPSESLTGSKTWVYIAPTPFFSVHRPTDPTARRVRHDVRRRPFSYPDSFTRARDADRSFHHMLQRHAVPADRAGGGGGARAPRAGGGLSRGADGLRADALQQRLSRRGARADPPFRARVRR